MEDEVKHISLLPSELLVKILCCDNVTYLDVCRLASTCQRMRNICLSEEIWKYKFFQCYTNVLPKANYNQFVSWRKLFILHYTCIKNVEQFLQDLAKSCYHYKEVPATRFHTILQYIDIDESNRDFIISYLQLIATSPLENLTKKYYAGKILQHIQHRYLSEAWHEYLLLPVNKQKLEIGTIYVYNWHCFLETISFEEISMKLDGLADEVKYNLKRYHPDNPVLKTELYDTIDFNLWNSTDTRNIISAINRVLFEEHCFYAENNSSLDLININKALVSKCCADWVMTVIYQSVARRLGVLLETLPPSVHLLRWKEHPNEQASYKQYTYLNTNESGRFLCELQCHHLHNEENVISPRRWFHNIVTKLLRLGRITEGQLMVRNYMKLAVLLHPDDLDMLVIWIQFNLNAHLNLQQMLKDAEKLLNSEPRLRCIGEKLVLRIEEELAKDGESKPEAVVPKRRASNEDVEFSVGLIMKHRRYEYMCVIIGWNKDHLTSKNLCSDADSIPNNQGNHPYYNILVSDGSIRYASQEYLCMPDHSQQIQHDDIGRYFQKFCHNYYLANEQTMENYPDDLQVTQQIVQEHYGFLEGI
ncbi:F-box only protein 21 isoform X1 [Argonauta hians]